MVSTLVFRVVGIELVSMIVEVILILVVVGIMLVRIMIQFLLTVRIAGYSFSHFFTSLCHYVIDHLGEVLLRLFIEGIVDLRQLVREACRPVERFLSDAESFRIIG